MSVSTCQECAQNQPPCSHKAPFWSGAVRLPSFNHNLGERVRIALKDDLRSLNTIRIHSDAKICLLVNKILCDGQVIGWNQSCHKTSEIALENNGNHGVDVAVEKKRGYEEIICRVVPHSQKKFSYTLSRGKIPSAIILYKVPFKSAL